MDLKLHKPQVTCAMTARGFAPGEPFHSALVRGSGAMERVDVCDEAWQGPPAGAVAWWRSRYPAAGASGPTLAPVELLLDALEGLDDAADEPLRYLLALQLVRRRVLRIIDEEPDAAEGGGTVVFACRKRGRDYRVRAASPAEAAAAGVEERLAALLWSGDAA